MTWEDDQSGNVSITGTEVRFVGPDKGEYHGNAIWLDEDGYNGEWVWTVLEGSKMWLGVGEKDKFGPGYKMKGFLYGGPGNLSDGSSLVTGHWGPKFGPGDKVGMRLCVSSGRVLLSYSHNTVGLGPAYDIQGWTGGPLYPIVSLTGPGQAVSIQSSSGGNFSESTELGAGIEGDWMGQDVKLSIEAVADNRWDVSACVGNVLRATVNKTEDGFRSAGVASTMMMPPPHLQEREAALGKLLEELTDISREGVSLRVSAGSISEVLTPAPRSGPATRDMVNWLN